MGDIVGRGTVGLDGLRGLIERIEKLPYEQWLKMFRLHLDRKVVRNYMSNNNKIIKVLCKAVENAVLQITQHCK